MNRHFDQNPQNLRHVAQPSGKTMANRAIRLFPLIFGLLLLGLGGCQRQAAVTPVAPNPGALAPPFTVTLVDGTQVALDDLRGRPLLLNFWATWCEPCKREMPLLQALANDAGDGVPVVLAVNYGEEQAHVADYVAGAGYTMPVVLDPDMKLARTYLVHGMPTSFFIDRDGVVRRVHVGELTSDFLQGFLAEVQ
jgi:thiol-disulfide isomerase/thioredoxin